MPLRVGSIDVLEVPTRSPESSDPRYDGPEQSKTILPAQFRKSSEHAAFQVTTVFEKNAEIMVRDGAKLRADIFRPVDPPSGTVPALIAWSPYGKSGRGGLRLDIVQGRVGVPKGRLSGFESFEAPDPAEWTARGYAIVNVDARGVYDSEGDIRWWGSAEGRDGYDVVEAIGKMPWCNGSVALVGNSWLAIAQWFIAAEQPPHLKCIAPFEGASDAYRETLCRGGVPQPQFSAFVRHQLVGRGKQEDVPGMLAKYPYVNEYWEDKRAIISRIDVPAFILASYSTMLHTMGSFRGFQDIQHDKKWLRVHPTQEWYDMYQPETNDELQCFLDRYTKGIENGWEETPQVRVSILRFNQPPIVNHVFSGWPVPSTTQLKLYLEAEKTLSTISPIKEDCLSYQSDVEYKQMDDDPEELCFSYTFEQQFFLVGCARAVLYMSCTDHDDMDVYVQLRKADRQGNILQNINVPLKNLGVQESEVESINPLKYLGPTGILRASHRSIDANLSWSDFPEHDYTKTESITPGQVVKLEIGLWQAGIAFEPGERIVLKISGHNMVLAEFPPLRGTCRTGNKGKHYVHLGGEQKSHVLIPMVTL